MTAMELAVELRSVRKTYGSGEGTVTALAGLSAAFPAGSFTAVMGPSGSGKSTLLQCAAGLDRPDSGQVLLGGTDLGTLDEHRLTLLRRDRIGFVFQSFNLVSALTAAQNVRLPLLLAGRRPSEEEVGRALSAVGLAERATHRPGELSGGQRQRVAIARALITRPDVLFADEPTGALDTRSGKDVLELLRDVVDRHGSTVVMVTHDPVAASYADAVVFLTDGQVMDRLTGPTADQVAARMTKLERG
ncbi:ABC transporter ATP-binding protein [[Actinomadura] parvosata subsp. kistnae]|uniref:ABC transporter n=2 Tax=Nonomuraea TaxID=83681 RepID=A0A1V0ACB3_9ACTN|nr:ABC transporter [Nonomuraea sp. ATCC 55076]SPL93874.1 ABC transporter ATP-binding protein [Actinomadura parvosata subsp. kistnae]